MMRSWYLACVLAALLLSATQQGCVLPGDDTGDDNANVSAANDNQSEQETPNENDNDDGTGSGDNPGQDVPAEVNPDCAFSMGVVSSLDMMFVMSDPFDEADALFSATFVGGYAAEVTIDVGGEEGIRCSGYLPDVAIDVEDGVVSLTAALIDEATLDACTVDLEGVIDDCGMTLIAGQPVEVSHVAAEGSAVVGGEVYALGDLQILRMSYGDFDGGADARPCDEPPTGLGDMNWDLSNTNYYVDFPGFGGFGGLDESPLYIDISGVGEAVEYAWIESSFEDSACEPINTEGTISFDGQTLSISVTVAASVDEGEPEGQCSFEFTGEAGECLVVADEYYGDTTLVVVEGAGTYGTYSGESGEVTTMYLSLYTYSEPEQPEPIEDRCIDPIDGFDESGGGWQIVPVNPYGDEGFEALQGLTVYGDGLEVFEFFIYLDGGDDFDACYGESGGGSVSFDGQNLTVDVAHVDEFAECGATFAGAVESCETYGGYFGGDDQVLRVVGEGVTTINGVDTPMTELYIVRNFGGEEFPPFVP